MDFIKNIEGMRKREAIAFLTNNSALITQEIYEGMLSYVGIAENELYLSTPKLIISETKRIIRREFETNPELKKIDKSISDLLNKRVDYLFDSANEGNKNRYDQQLFRDKVMSDDSVELLEYVLNELTDNHCECCLENAKKRVYNKELAPELPNTDCHGPGGHGCFCYYRPVTSQEQLDSILTSNIVQGTGKVEKDWINTKDIKKYMEG